MVWGSDQVQNTCDRVAHGSLEELDWNIWHVLKFYGNPFQKIKSWQVPTLNKVKR